MKFSSLSIKNELARSILTVFSDPEQSVSLIDEATTLDKAQCLAKIDEYLKWINSFNIHSVMVLGAPSIDYLCLCYALIISNRCFIPLHPSTSAELIDNYLQRYPIDLLLIQAELGGEFSITFKENRGFLYHQPEIFRNACLVPGEILFTSGTTGFPKAVHYQFNTISDYVNWCVGEFELNQDDCFLCTSEFSFAASIRALFVPLYSGASLCFIERHSANKLQAIINGLLKKRITVLNLTPSLFKQLVRHLREQRLLECLKTVRLVLLSGEPIHSETINDWYDDINPQTVFYNLYGTTECLIPFYKKINASLTELEALHLGNLRAGCDFKLVSDSTKGYELYLTGNISTAYLDPELNQASYLEINDRRFVKSNDFVTMQAGQLYFSGRSQRLVKRYGQLISLNQIEFILKKAFPETGFIAVQEESKVLVFIESIENYRLLKQVRHHLQAHLPEYMHPNEFIFSQEFPLTASGKIDYLKLKQQLVSSKINHLTDYFRSFFRCREFNLETRIGDLGLESIDYLEMAETIQKITGKWLDISKIKDTLPLCDIESCLKNVDEISSPSRNRVRLNPIQKAVYSRELYGLDKEGVYQIAFWCLKQEIDTEKLQIAIAETLANHFMLSSQLKWFDDDFYFIQSPLQASFLLKAPVFFGDTKLLSQLKTYALRDQLVRVYVYKKKNRYFLVMAYHHIAIDGWSALLMREEIFHRYEGKLSRKQKRNDEVLHLNQINEISADAIGNIEELRACLASVNFGDYNHLGAIFKGASEKRNTCFMIEKNTIDAFSDKHTLQDSPYSVIFALLLQQAISKLAKTDKIFFYISFSNRNLPIPQVRDLMTNLAIGLPVFLSSSHLPLKERAHDLKNTLAVYFRIANYTSYSRILENDLIPESIVDATKQPYMLVYTYINKLVRDSYTQNKYIDWDNSINWMNCEKIRIIFIRIYDMGDHFVFTLDTQMKTGLHECLLDEFNNLLK
ncbi:AMP-binding protein [Legionella quinlivanii]|uniref:AMP-binding protein n=1 Tax=Legionella quinlivanii TaxID=45073 RepID=UPI0022446273|nr:AMP-binding protein [Legionella quinlivanii]MCW8451515.1 AMP-binding protein [Legionella quinlivanii]